MKFIFSCIFLLTLSMTSCSKDASQQKEEQTETVSKEIDQLNDEIEHIDNLKNDIQDSSEELDDLLNDLNTD